MTMVSEEIRQMLKARDPNFVGVQWSYFVDGPGNIIVFFWTSGSCYVACIGDDKNGKRKILWCKPA